MRTLSLLLWAGLGCSYEPRVGDALDPDGPPPPCSTLDSRCQGATTLLTCSAIGEAPVPTECPWGCLETPIRCGHLSPSGGGATTTDLDALDGLGDVTLTDAEITGNDGMITNASSANFTHALRGPSDSIAVFRFRRLTISGDLRLLGTKSIVLIADEPITVNGVIDARGPCGANDEAPEPGPGGFAGGPTSQAAGLGPGGTAGGASNAGGGGGGNGGAGGRGGNALTNNAGGVLGDDAISLLRGGGGGSAGGGGGGFGRGGGGGGAIQLISNTAVVFGVGSGINAGGCGGDGDSGGGADGGGGGGGGGTILIEAPQISGTSTLAVNGGAGGSGGEGLGDTGEAGKLSLVAAIGQPGGGAAGAGGNGAAAAVLDGLPGVSVSGQDGGGGGGGIGRIRFNTRTGEISLTGDMSPALTDVPTTATAAIAVIE